jgi:hypothetical protein
VRHVTLGASYLQNRFSRAPRIVDQKSQPRKTCHPCCACMGGMRAGLWSIRCDRVTLNDRQKEVRENTISDSLREAQIKRMGFVCRVAVNGLARPAATLLDYASKFQTYAWNTKVGCLISHVCKAVECMRLGPTFLVTYRSISHGICRYDKAIYSTAGTNAAYVNPLHSITSSFKSLLHSA